MNTVLGQLWIMYDWLDASFGDMRTSNGSHKTPMRGLLNFLRHEKLHPVGLRPGLPEVERFLAGYGITGVDALDSFGLATRALTLGLKGGFHVLCALSCALNIGVKVLYAGVERSLLGERNGELADELVDMRLEPLLEEHPAISSLVSVS